MNFKIPIHYALVGTLFVLALVSFRFFAVNISHYIDPTVPPSIIWTVLAAIFAVIFLIAGAVVLYIRREKSSQEITIFFKQDERDKTIDITGKKFAFSMQLPISYTFGFIFLGDAAAGFTTWLGWLGFGLVFLFLAIFIYGIFRLRSKSDQQCDTG